jgi:hypothetical protein
LNQSLWLKSLIPKSFYINSFFYIIAASGHLLQSRPQTSFLHQISQVWYRNDRDYVRKPYQKESFQTELRGERTYCFSKGVSSIRVSLDCSNFSCFLQPPPYWNFSIHHMQLRTELTLKEEHEIRIELRKNQFGTYLFLKLGTYGTWISPCMWDFIMRIGWWWW